MKKTSKKVFDSVIRETKFRNVLVKSSVLALVCTLFTVPSFHHMLVSALQSETPPVFKYDYKIVLAVELFMLFFTCFLSSLSGFSLNEKYQLPGLWECKNPKKMLPIIVVIAVVLGGLSFLLFDRHFFYVSPESYPSDMIYVITRPFKLAFTNEIILRFGLVTIFVGLFKNRILSVILVSVFVSFLTIKYFRFVGIDYPFNDFFMIQFIISFIANFLLGLIYVTHGLLYSMVLHFLFGLRLLFVVLILG